jgi:asparagine synthase (glutamine-hydrolysing)
MEFFFEHPQLKRLVELTLNPDQVKQRGYFDPDVVQALVAKMETREFLYLKQVMLLVILELWHMIFIDRKKLW